MPPSSHSPSLPTFLSCFLNYILPSHNFIWGTLSNKLEPPKFLPLPLVNIEERCSFFCTIVPRLNMHVPPVFIWNCNFIRCWDFMCMHAYTICSYWLIEGKKIVNAVHLHFQVWQKDFTKNDKQFLIFFPSAFVMGILLLLLLF